MKVKDILVNVEYKDIIATAEIGDRNLTPPDHVVNVASIAMNDPNFIVSPEVANFVTGWIAQQVNIQEQVADVIARLEKVAPLPTPEQLINGNPDWPTWMNEWWASVLRFPWAGRLAEAALEAGEWLDGKS